MNQSLAARQFLEDVFEHEHGRPLKSDEEFVEWCLVKWANLRSMAPNGASGGDLLGHLLPPGGDKFPGMTRGGSQ